MDRPAPVYSARLHGEECVRRGATLVEAAVVLSIAGLLLGICVVPVRRLFDGTQARNATAALMGALAFARSAAIARSELVEVAIDAPAARLTIVAGADTLARDSLGGRFGVTLDATASRIRYTPTGHGWGLSNTRIIARRGTAADTLTVSRLGRVRR
jgi:hypothetical protein